jgi:hypothetical protein
MAVINPAITSGEKRYRRSNAFLTAGNYTTTYRF